MRRLARVTNLPRGDGAPGPGIARGRARVGYGGLVDDERRALVWKTPLGLEAAGAEGLRTQSEGERVTRTWSQDQRKVSVPQKPGRREAMARPVDLRVGRWRGRAELSSQVRQERRFVPPIFTEGGDTWPKGPHWGCGSRAEHGRPTNRDWEQSNPGPELSWGGRDIKSKGPPRGWRRRTNNSAPL